MTSTSAYTTILDLPVATTLSGSEWVPMVQGGTDKRAQSGQISAQLNQGAGFVMASCAIGFTDQRILTGSTNIQVADGGAGSTITVSVITSAGFSVVGRSTSAAGATTTITGTQDQILRVSSAGTTLGFGAINLASSFAVSNFLDTEFGGLGRSLLTPWSILAGGTTSSGAVQQISTGVAGQVLTYVSSTALPTWNTVAGTVSSGLSGQLAFFSSDGTNVRGSSFANISSATVTLGTTTGLSGNLALASSAGAVTTLAPSTATNTATFPFTSTILIGRDTVDTLTGKTFDTAGSSNIFRISANAISSYTGVGATVVLSSSPTIQSAVLQAVSSFGIRTTGAAFDLNIASTEALTASRTLFVRVNNVNRNLNLLGDFTIASSFAMSLTSTAASSVTMPTAGTVINSTGTYTLENKTINTVSNTFQISSNTISSASSVLDIITSSAGALLYRSTGTTWNGLTIGTSAQVLTGGTVPQWAAAGAGTVTNVATTYPVSGGPITNTGTIVSQAPTNSGRFVYSSTIACLYQPYNGDTIKVAGSLYQIPSSGVLFTSTTGLSTSTLYYAYVSVSGSTLVANLSTSTHSPSTVANNIGTEIMSTNNGMSLVGMVYISSVGSFFTDAQATRYVASWFNRRPRNAAANLTGSTAAGPYVRVSSAAEPAFISWSGDAIAVSGAGYGANSTALAVFSVSIGVGATRLNVDQATQNTTAAADNPIGMADAVESSADGRNTVSLWGGASAGTTSFNTVWAQAIIRQ